MCLIFFIFSAANYAGRDAVVAGWGKTGENEIPSNILRKVTLPVWTKDECLNSNYGQRKISENMFCAGFPGGKRDSCQVYFTNRNVCEEISKSIKEIRCLSKITLKLRNCKEIL